MSKAIVVTGGTKGIGRAVIEKFASNDFNIITCARSKEDLAELKEEIESTHKVNLTFIKADLSERRDIKSFVDFIKDSGKSVDVLVNNSGFFVPGKITEEEEGVLEKMISSNVLSAYHLTRGLINEIINSKGHIFNMCSVASLYAYKNGGSYSITKFALLGFSKVLREELKEKEVRVTAVMPGATYTASWEGSGLPRERFMKPEDVAEAIFSGYSLSERTVVEEIILRPQLGDI